MSAPTAPKLEQPLFGYEGKMIMTTLCSDSNLSIGVVGSTKKLVITLIISIMVVGITGYISAVPASAEAGKRLCYYEHDDQEIRYTKRDRDRAFNKDCSDLVRPKDANDPNGPRYSVKNIPSPSNGPYKDIDLTICENFTEYRMEQPGYDICDYMGYEQQNTDADYTMEELHAILPGDENSEQDVILNPGTHRNMQAGWRVKAGAIGVPAINCTAGPQVSWLEDGKTIYGMVWPEHCGYTLIGGVKTESNIVSDISPIFAFWKRQVLGEVVYRNKQMDLALVRYTHEDDEGDLNPYKGSPYIMTNTVLRGLSVKPVYKTNYSLWDENLSEYFLVGEEMCWTGMVTDVRCGALKPLTPVDGEAAEQEKLDWIETPDLRCAKKGDSGAPVWQDSGSGHLRLGGMLMAGNQSCRNYFRDWATIDEWVTGKLGTGSEFHYLYGGASN